VGIEEHVHAGVKVFVPLDWPCGRIKTKALMVGKVPGNNMRPTEHGTHTLNLMLTKQKQMKLAHVGHKRRTCKKTAPVKACLSRWKM